MDGVTDAKTARGSTQLGPTPLSGVDANEDGCVELAHEVARLRTRIRAAAKTLSARDQDEAAAVAADPGAAKTERSAAERGLQPVSSLARRNATDESVSVDREAAAEKIKLLKARFATLETLADEAAGPSAEQESELAQLRDHYVGLEPRRWALAKASPLPDGAPADKRRRVLSRIARLFPAFAEKAARIVWRALPISAAERGRVAARLFTLAPALFAWTRPYRAWNAQTNPAAPTTPAERLPGEQSNSDRPSALDSATPLLATAPPTTTLARAIAFYLPQFHPIPENDSWWGEGFTEWAKVKPATPAFAGHDQPRIPGELGYYDLMADDAVMARQAELAKLHGVEGFCFYFYWFAGKRLLEGPLLKLLERTDIDLPFCLCWANENWTRRWDGRDDHVLIGQKHSPEDDLAFIAHVARYLDDPRAIRINGRPLLVVYRPELLPDAKATARRWRRWFREQGKGELYLAFTHSFKAVAPTEYGFDAAIEFPPNNMGLEREPAPLAEGRNLNIFDWRKLADRSRFYSDPGYTLFRGVNPSWDNTPRRPNDGTVFINAAPSRFQAWLERAIADTARRFPDPQQRLIFINAWNEWAEGACLEPDRTHGYAWLEAARRALDPAARDKKVIVVTHDLHRHGAQYIALNLARMLARRFGRDVATLAGGDGALAPEFAELGPLTILDRDAPDAAIAALAARGYKSAIVNSAASGWMAPALARHGVEMVGLIHELPTILTQLNLEDDVRMLDRTTRSLIFPAAHVRDADAAALGVAWKNAKLHPQGLYKAETVSDLAEKQTARVRIIKRLGLPADARIVLGVGYGDRRKGVDIFLDWASALTRVRRDVHFIWVGDLDPSMKALIADRLRGALRAHVHLPGFVADTRDFYLAADLYALCSREDPFPSTALEAFAAATPVIMLAGAGGIEAFVPEGCVEALAAPDAFASAALRWLDDADARRRAGLRGRDLIHERFGYAAYAGAIADALDLGVPNISVVVPNYNYAPHLERRLASILEQTLTPRELIFLDDASTDGSIAVAERMLARANLNWRIIANEKNSGRVFDQWRKGANLAKGDLVWIAESDDWADPRFLEIAAQPFRRSDVVLSFTQSNQMAGDGALLARNYQDYVADVSPDRWLSAFISDGPDAVRETLSIKNTIPNVSAVLFRRTPLVDTLEKYAAEIADYRVAGDWCVYVNLLRQGALAFAPASLNYHRRHESSVTNRRFDLAELAELARMQLYVAREFAPPEEGRREARAYLERLVAQFGLTQRRTRGEIEAALRGIAPQAM